MSSSLLILFDKLFIGLIVISVHLWLLVDCLNKSSRINNLHSRSNANNEKPGKGGPHI